MPVDYGWYTYHAVPYLPREICASNSEAYFTGACPAAGIVADLSAVFMADSIGESLCKKSICLSSLPFQRLTDNGQRTTVNGQLITDHR